jgi:hypothetical protein
MCGLTPRTEHPGFGEAQTEGSLCDFEPAAGRRLMPAHKFTIGQVVYYRSTVETGAVMPEGRAGRGV